MTQTFKKCSFLAVIAILLIESNLFAQKSPEIQFNTRRNFVSINSCIGGGDYPFGGFGLTLSHRLKNDKTWIGLGAHYIGYTRGDEFRDDVQIIPIMVDLRQEFSRSENGRFASFVFLDGGYVVSLTGNDFAANGEFEYGNGWAINPGIAFKVNLLRNLGLMLDISWMHHTSSRKYLSPDNGKLGRKSWNTCLIRGSFFF